MKYKGYEISLSNERGGKAGTGHNKTGTIQVKEIISPVGYLLKAQFRYTIASNESMARAYAKAKEWIDTHK